MKSPQHRFPKVADFMTIRSIPSSPIALSFYITALFAFLGAMLILAVVGGRELKFYRWNHERAIVLNTYLMCRMVYGSSHRKGRPCYLTTIPCEDVSNFVSKHHSEYIELRPQEINYLTLGFFSTGLKPKVIKVSDIGEDHKFSVGRQMDILVHPGDPSRIDRFPKRGELYSYISSLILASAAIFFGMWLRFSLGDMQKR